MKSHKETQEKGVNHKSTPGEPLKRARTKQRGSQMRLIFLLFASAFLVMGCPEKKKPGFVEEEDPFKTIPTPPYRETNPADRNSDVDCDGIPDWEEEEKTYAGGRKTDPQNRDSDGDGIWDGVEIGRYFSPDPLCANYFPVHLLSAEGRTITNPTLKDTDCDGLSDGDEDRNKNGRLDTGETDPTNVDTDGDGLWDGLEVGVTRTTAADPANCPRTKYDKCPESTTDPLNPDTDGDGIWDGAEDTNKDGCLDAGETDPNDKDDPHPTRDAEVLHACSSKNLLKISIQRNFAAQVALGLPWGFANSYVDIERTKDGRTTNGLMGFDGLRNVAFVSWRHSGTLAGLEGLENLANEHIKALGAEEVRRRNFRSWDSMSGGANALSIDFEIPGKRSPGEGIKSIAETLLGEGSETSIDTTSKEGEQLYLKAQYVLREKGDPLVVITAAGNNRFSQEKDGAFALMDVAGGAALARYFDRTVVQCERSVVGHRPVDFLFVVGDVPVTANWQDRLDIAAITMVNALNNSTLDWRVALVTPSYHVRSPRWPNSGVVRGFTRDVQQFQAWLRPKSTCELDATGPTRRCTPGTDWHGNAYPPWNGLGPECLGDNSYLSIHGANGGCWIGDFGSHPGILGAARLALMDISSPEAEERIRLRENADIVVVIIDGADDLTSGLYTVLGLPENIQHFIDFFQGRDTVATRSGAFVPVPAIRPGQTIPVHAIRRKHDINVRIPAVVNATGGFLAFFEDQAGTENTMRAIVDSAIGNAGVKTQKPLIGASLRVAMANPRNPNACNTADVPRSRKDGFDYDGIAQTVTLFGACRPPDNQQSRVAISYRAWESSEETRMPCEKDIHFDPDESNHCKNLFFCDSDKDVCVCPNQCGGCPEGMVCNPNTCTCELMLV